MTSQTSPLTLSAVLDVLNASRTEATAIVFGVFETPRSRKFLNMFVRREKPDFANNPWEVWFSESHLVGYFDTDTVEKMLIGWMRENKDIRLNPRGYNFQ